MKQTLNQYAEARKAAFQTCAAKQAEAAKEYRAALAAIDSAEAAQAEAAEAAQQPTKSINLQTGKVTDLKTSRIKLHSANSLQTVAVNRLSVGEYCRKVGQRKIWQFEGYCRTNRKYQLTDVNDISNSCYVKADKLVEIGFEY